MNFAFPALVVFLLALPGIVLRYAYARGSWVWTSPTSIRRLSDEFAFGLIYSIPIHVVALSLTSRLGFTPNVQAVLMFLAGHYGKDDNQLVPSLAAVSDHYFLVSSYFLGIYVAAGVAGTLSHHLVRWAEFDLYLPFFRFDNYWFYTLRGEVAAFRENQLEGSPSGVSKPDGVYLSSVVTHGSVNYLYRGIVVDFTFDPDGKLDTIAVTDAHRRLLSKDSRTHTLLSEEDAPRYYNIQGNILVLRCSEIQTINLDFFWLEDEVAVAGEAEETDVP